MATNDMSAWLRAATEAVDDFVSYGLAGDGEIHGINPSQGPDDGHLLGSRLILTYGKDKVEIGLLATRNTLKNLTRAMLLLEPGESIEKDQVTDATKEIINIISGGVKSRMHTEVEAELLLGIPVFLDGGEAEAKRSSTCIEKVIIAGQPAEIYAQQPD